MARPGKTIDEKMAALDEKIAKAEERLQALKEERKELENTQKKQEFAELIDFMKQKGVSTAEVKDMLNAREQQN